MENGIPMNNIKKIVLSQQVLSDLNTTFFKDHQVSVIL